jgi:hypothetical protein
MFVLNASFIPLLKNLRYRKHYAFSRQPTAQRAVFRTRGYMSVSSFLAQHQDKDLACLKDKQLPRRDPERKENHRYTRSLPQMQLPTYKKPKKKKIAASPIANANEKKAKQTPLRLQYRKRVKRVPLKYPRLKCLMKTIQKAFPETNNCRLEIKYLDLMDGFVLLNSDRVLRQIIKKIDMQYPDENDSHRRKELFLMIRSKRTVIAGRTGIPPKFHWVNGESVGGGKSPVVDSSSNQKKGSFSFEDSYSDDFDARSLTTTKEVFRLAKQGKVAAMIKYMKKHEIGYGLTDEVCFDHFFLPQQTKKSTLCNPTL